MADTERIITTTVEQIKTLLTGDRVIGEAIRIGDATIVPLMSVGFGFGGGGSVESASESGEGAGAGGGIRPVALVIADASGVRVEPVKQSSSALIESVAAIAQRVMDEKGTGAGKERSNGKTGDDGTAGGTPTGKSS
ncbi:MAG: GerW family sporulation protein [Alkalispirochaeta sp.]